MFIQKAYYNMFFYKKKQILKVGTLETYGGEKQGT